MIPEEEHLLNGPSWQERDHRGDLLQEGTFQVSKRRNASKEMVKEEWSLLKGSEHPVPGNIQASTGTKRNVNLGGHKDSGQL